MYSFFSFFNLRRETVPSFISSLGLSFHCSSPIAFLSHAVVQNWISQSILELITSKGDRMTFQAYTNCWVEQTFIQVSTKTCSTVDKCEGRDFLNIKNGRNTSHTQGLVDMSLLKLKSIHKATHYKQKEKANERAGRHTCNLYSK